MWNKRRQSAPYKSTDSLIGHGGTLEGKVHCDTNLRIEGNFSGKSCVRGQLRSVNREPFTPALRHRRLLSPARSTAT